MSTLRTLASRWFPAILVMAAALAVVAPFFFLGNASGHDIAFHLSSWMDVAGQWRQGVFYPRWAEWANYGFGEPRFIFYPPASWILGAALGWILPWQAVPGSFIWLALVLTGASMYSLAREWMPAGDATRAAVFYAVNPYHLVVVYSRSDFAELLASALFPLVVRYALSSGGHVPRRAIVPLALAFAAFWLTNAPAAVVTTYSLVLLLVVLAVMRRSAAPLLAGGAAVFLGFLLAGFYILPAAFEQGWVNIAEALSSGLRPEQNFLFTSTNDPEHNLFNLLVSTIATAQLAVTGGAAVVARRPGDAQYRETRKLWWAALALWAASVALMLPVSAPAWRYLPKLRFVQFPWRWMLPLGVSFAVLVAAAIRERRTRWLWTALLAVSLVGVSAYLVHHAWWDTEDVPVLRTAIREGRGYEGTDEYAPRGIDRTDLPAVEPLMDVAPADDAGSPEDRSSLPRVRVERWEAETKLIDVEAQQPATLELHLLNYPAWQVEVNGKPALARSLPDTGQMLVTVPSGHSRVRVQFTRTADRSAGILLSIGAGLLLVGLALANRRRERPASSVACGE
ncbi:MAG: 6-pyruvoyl-tetrahydropterin synthase-related protein [Candidatus Acidiferrales bacterium]